MLKKVSLTCKVMLLCAFLGVVFPQDLFSQIKQFRIVKSIPTPGNKPAGLTWDGSYLWYSDYNSPKILTRLNTSGTVLGTIPYVGSNPRELSWMSPSSIWVADNILDRIIQVSSSSGSWISEFPTVRGQVFGIAWDGSSLWQSDDNYNELYKTDKTGNLLNTLYFDPVRPIRGIAFDGQYLWIINSKEQIFQKIDRSTGKVLQEYGTPVVDPTGLAWDGSRLWTCSAKTLEIVQLDFNCGSACNIEVLVPNGNEQWQAGSEQVIVWSSCGTSGKVTIRYSVDAGDTWGDIAYQTDDDGRKLWQIPYGISSSECLIRVNDFNNVNCYDESDNFFTIVRGCEFTITSPNGGEVWQEKTTQNITWTSYQAGSSVNLYYSTNNGSSWTPIVTFTANDGTHPWPLPDVTGDQTQCRVKVEDASNPSCYDISNANFTIKDKPCSITVSSPNGGEVWEEKTVQQIKWVSSNTSGCVNIFYSLNGGQNWSAIVNSTPDDGEYVWSIPDVSGDKTQCLIKVEDCNNPSCSDISDGYFTIKDKPCSITVTSPNGGEVWDEKTVQKIKWTSSNSSGAMNLYYSLNGGQNWTAIVNSTLDDGEYAWQVPDVAGDKTQCLIKVEDANNAGCSDVSNGYFTIKNKACVITVQWPNGGEVIISPSVVDIRWSSSGCSDKVLIQYSKDGGNLWDTIMSDTPNDGTHTWSVPAGINSALCKVRIQDMVCSGCFDVSDNYFTIKPADQPQCNLKVLVPNAQVQWTAGSVRKVAWVAANKSGKVRLDYSLDGGMSWQVIESSTDDDGCYDWKIPSQSSRQCKLRVSDYGDMSCNDVSDAVFTIGAGMAPYILAQDVVGRKDEVVTCEVLVNGTTKEMGSFGFELVYDAADLEYQGVDKGTLTANWMQVNGNATAPGLLSVGGFHTTPIAVGSSGSLARIRFKVLAVNEVCRGGHLLLQNLVDGLIGMTMYHGTFSNALSCVLGDVNMDGSITPGDALCAFNMYLYKVAQGECATECSDYSADADCNGMVTPGDALIIFNAYLTKQPIKCPGLGKLSYVERELRLGGPGGAPGEVIWLPVELMNPQGVRSFGMEVVYPSDQMEYVGVGALEATRDWQEFAGMEVERGVIRIGAYDVRGFEESNSVRLLELGFKVKEGARGVRQVQVLHGVDDFAVLRAEGGHVELGEMAGAPLSWGLGQNYPNPFNQQTEISYEVAERGRVEIGVYNLQGQMVRRLISEEVSAGQHRVIWDGRDDHRNDVPSGMYLCKMVSGAYLATRKMILLR